MEQIDKDLASSDVDESYWTKEVNMEDFVTQVNAIGGGVKILFFMVLRLSNC